MRILRKKRKKVTENNYEIIIRINQAASTGHFYLEKLMKQKIN